MTATPNTRRNPSSRPLRPSRLLGLAAALVLPLAMIVVGPAQASTTTERPAAAGSDPSPSDAPTGLRINGLERPVDIDDVESPSFSWYVNTTEQSAYRIIVSSSEEDARGGRGTVWDSGRIASDVQTDVAYQGPRLDRGVRYHWAVQTWDAEGRASQVSEPTMFGTSIGADWSGAVPIWATKEYPGSEQRPVWDDYTVEMTVTTSTALGVHIRAADASNGYMWQLRADRNELVPHIQRGGTYTAEAAVPLPAGTLVPGVPAQVSIEVAGSMIRTSIGGAVVDEREDSSFAEGAVGVRTGRTESGTVSALRVTAHDGDTLYDYEPGDPSAFPCAQVADGALAVGNSASCLLAAPGATPVTADWAFLRTEFTLRDSPIASATLFATAGDFRAHKQYVFKAFVNGEFAGLGPTNHIGDESRYDGFDVTALLRQGAGNAIGVQAYTTGEERQRFLGQLTVTYADGSVEVYGTDTDWKALPGSPVLPDAGSIGTGFYSAPKENLDAREFPYGYTEPGYDDSSWSAAAAKPAFTDLQATPMAKVQEQLKDPVEIIDKGDGDYFVDFGRTWIGGVRYDIAAGTAGERTELRFGETTSAEHTVRHTLNTGNDYVDVVTLDDGAQTIDTWGMRVFRYLEIVDAPEPVTAENLKALALVYPFDADASRFTSSNDNLNQVYALAKNSIEALNLNFYTDSWTRERINYEADGYLQLMSSLYLMEDLSLGRYSMNYFADNRTWPTEWPLYVVLGVHDAWRQTGNLEQVAQTYDWLTEKTSAKWIDPATGLVGKATGSDGCDSRTDCDIVDWPTSQRDGYQFRHYNTVVNALSYRALRDMASMADALGRDADADTYTEQADRLRAAMNEYLYDSEGGRYDDGMDAQGSVTGHYALHASAFALAFGIPESDEVGRVADYVASKGMACSVYCAGFSISGLFDGGAADAAVGQLTGEGTSSWMNMIRLGAGATMEAWDPSQKSNLTYSHPWAASPAFHVPVGLFGIEPIGAGYTSFQVKPQPGSVDQARITVPSVKGSIGVAFAHDESGDLNAAVRVPGNTTADIVIPVAGGTKTLYRNGEAVAVEPVDGFATLSGVGAGCQTITASKTADAATAEYLAGLCTPSATDEPAAPDESDLTDDARGAVRVPDQAHRGDRITVDVDGMDAGALAHVWLFSEPTLLTSAALDEENSVDVEIPSDAELGDHRIAVTDADDVLIGWDDIEIVETPGEGPGEPGDSDADGSDGGADAGGADAGESEAGGDDLAITGGDIAGMIGLLLAALALAGVGTGLLVRRRRHREDAAS